jgi:uncharacterized protein with HEPN domain
MRPEDPDAAYLWDMLEAAKLVASFAAGKSLEEYRASVLLRSAVERQLEVIGEAARRVSAAFQAAHPEIPWRAIVGQRNILAHDYGEIDDSRVWGVAAEDIPRLIAQLEPLIPALPPD